MKPWLEPLWRFWSCGLQLKNQSGFSYAWPDAFSDGSCAGQLELMREVLGVGGNSSKRFESSASTMKAMEYERYVASGGIPTRDEFHDWFNGLVWLAYPRAKSQINCLHVREADASILRFQAGSAWPRSGNQRSALRDALTLWDESGAVLLTSSSTVQEALREHDWQHLFVQLRSEWGVSILPYCFGHGLLDALRVPHKGLCAKVKVVHVDAAILNQFVNPVSNSFNNAGHSANPLSPTLDEIFLSVINQLKSPRDLSPLPVMGVPGWFEANTVPGFYADESVFRKKPTRVGPG